MAKLPAIPVGPSCSTVSASQWNSLLRRNRLVTLRPINRSKIKRSPVCVKTYRNLKRLVERREARCGGGTPASNRCLGRRIAATVGWTGTQWQCLDTLWGVRESGWNHRSDNPTSDAYGIPQALPGSKMGPGWQDNPRVQIRWGLSYIKGRYKTPCGALAHSHARNWY